MTTSAQTGTTVGSLLNPQPGLTHRDGPRHEEKPQ